MPACEDILCGALDSSASSSRRLRLSPQNNVKVTETDAGLIVPSRAISSRRATSTSLPPLKATSSGASTDPRHPRLQPRRSLCEERTKHLLESEHRSIVEAASLASCRAGSMKRDISLSNFTVEKDNRPGTSESLLRRARGTDRELPEVRNDTHGSRPCIISHSVVRTRYKSVDIQFPSDGGAEVDDLMVRPSSSSWSSAYPSSTFSDHEGGIRNARHGFSARRKSVDDIEGSRPSKPLVSQSGSAARRCSTSHAQRTARKYQADTSAFLNDMDDKASPPCRESDSAPDTKASYRPRKSRVQQNLRAVTSVATMCASVRRSRTKKQVSWSDDVESGSLHLASGAVAHATSSDDIQPPPVSSDDVAHDVTMRGLGEILRRLEQSAAERAMLDAIEKSLPAMASGCDDSRLSALQGLLSRVFPLSKTDVDILVKMAQCNSTATKAPAITPQKLRLVLSYVSSYQSQNIDDTCLQILGKTPEAAAMCLRVLSIHDSAAVRPIRHPLL